MAVDCVFVCDLGFAFACGLALVCVVLGFVAGFFAAVFLLAVTLRGFVVGAFFVTLRAVLATVFGFVFAGVFLFAVVVFFLTVFLVVLEIFSDDLKHLEQNSKADYGNFKGILMEHCRKEKINFSFEKSFRNDEKRRINIISLFVNEKHMATESGGTKYVVLERRAAEKALKTLGVL